MEPQNPYAQRAGSWAGWKPLQSENDATIPLQVGDTCGHCAARMLLAILGKQVDQKTISTIIGHENKTRAAEIVTAINTAMAANCAKAVFVDSDFREFALYHPRAWIAMIKEYNRGAHWVLVKGNGDSETLEVLDPADASRNLVHWSEFDAYWTQIAVIIQ